MAKRYLGVHVGRDHVHAVQLGGRAAQPTVEAAVSLPLAGTSAAEAIRALGTRGDCRAGTAVVSALAGAHTFLRQCDTELLDAADIRRVLRFQLEEDLPVAATELVLDIASLESTDTGRRAYVGAVRRVELDVHVRALEEAGFKPATVDLEAAALMRAAGARPGGLPARAMLVYVEPTGAVLVIARHGHPVAAREVEFGEVDEPAALLRREIALTWRVTTREPLGDDDLVVLAGDTGAIDPAGLPGTVETLPVAPGLTGAQAVAAELAHRGLTGAGGADFLAVQRRESKPPRGLKLELAVAAVLLVALGAVWTFTIWHQLHDLDSRDAALKAKMRQVFTETVPDVTRVVNEQVQLDQALVELRREYQVLAGVMPGQWPAANLLQMVSATIPKDGKTVLNELRIQGGAVQLAGTTDSFGTVDALKDRFAAVDGVRAVDDRNLSVDTTERTVHFELLLTVGEEVAK